MATAETSDRRRLVMRRMIRRPRGQSRLSAGERVRRKFPNFWLWVYIAQPVGVTEWNNSVAPRCITVYSYSNSV